MKFRVLLALVLLALISLPAYADSWKVTHRDGGRKSAWVVTQSADCKDGKCATALPPKASSVSVSSSVGGNATTTVQASTCESGQCSTSSRRSRRGR